MEIIRKKRRVLALLAAALLLAALLGGCGGDQGSASAAAMGRYIETRISLPEELSYLLYTDWQGGQEITVYGMRATESAGANVHIWESQDGGGSWTRNETPLLDESFAATLSWVSSFTLDGDGVLHMICYAQEEESASPRIMRLVNGVWEAVGGELTISGGSVENIKMLQDGYYAAGFYFTLALFGPDGGVVNTFEAEDRILSGSYFALDDCFAYGGKGALRLVSTEEGQIIRELPIQQPSSSENNDYILSTPPQTVYCWDEETKSICYANNNGIFQMDKEGALTEKIVDGSLTSLSLPSVTLTNLQFVGDSFLVEAQDDDSNPTLYRYDYNGDVPTVPDVQLRLYTLEDLPSVRQAIGAFQDAHPEVMIQYEVGLSGDDSVSRQDAIKALATKIMAEDGPDILVLDGLPWESYGEKGALLDIRDIAQAQSENCYSAVVSAFDTGNACYAIPTRFQLPLLLSEGSAVSQVQTPSGLADYLSQQENPRINQQHDLAFYTMGKYYAPRWFREDSSFDRDTFTEDLLAFERIQAQLGSLGVPPTDAGRDYSVVSLLYGESSLSLSLESLFALKSLPSISTALAKRDGALSLYPSSQKYFEPLALMGVNAASSHSDLAGEFIRCALSEEAQLYDLGDGLPVNRVALERNIDFDDDANRYWTYGFEGYRPESQTNDFFIVTTERPDDAFKQNFRALLEAMTSPLYMDEDVLSLLLERGSAYLGGEAPLESALSDIEKELLLRSAE